jgi:hypothetical protein
LENQESALKQLQSNALERLIVVIIQFLSVEFGGPPTAKTILPLFEHLLGRLGQAFANTPQPAAPENARGLLACGVSRSILARHLRIAFYCSWVFVFHSTFDKLKCGIRIYWMNRNWVGNKYAPIFNLEVKSLCFVEGQVGGSG